MREYIHEYMLSIDSYIADKKHSNLKETIENHLVKIEFFQEERRIHLYVTLFYALITLLFLGMMAVSLIFFPIALILTVFLILYIYHYFYLENHVQYLYKQYDKLKELDK